MTDVHPAAWRGFGAAADAYRRGRPEYPRELLGWLRDTLRLGPGSRVIDLGAGTGKFTRALHACGADVTAVEPVAAMREALFASLPGTTVLAGSAQAMPCGSADFDAVVCAQSFHWFSTPQALAEIHRVLKPGGVLGLVWNVRDESVGWVADMTRILLPHEGDAPRFHSGRWREAFDGSLFSTLHETSFAHEHVGTPKDVIVNRCLSVSFIAALPAAQREVVASQLEALVAAHPQWRDDETIRVPYRTLAFNCRRLS